MIPEMPGKQDPKDYFPLNFSHPTLYDFNNVNFDDGCAYFINRSNGSEQFSVGKFANSDDDGSGCATRGRTRNVSFNETLPPENPDVEEDEDDSASVQSSDLDLDDMDTLVLSIREKLRMEPNAMQGGFWTDDDSNQSECSTGGSRPVSKRKATRPASWRRNQSSHYRSLGTIQKHRTSHPCHRWWTSKSFNDISHQDRSKDTNNPRQDDPYHVLQELIESGSLIKEAVRRISTKKRLGTHHQLNTNSTAAEMQTQKYPTLPLSAQ